MWISFNYLILISLPTDSFITSLLTDFDCETASHKPPPWQVLTESVPASKPSAPQPKKKEDGGHSSQFHHRKSLTWWHYQLPSVFCWQWPAYLAQIRRVITDSAAAHIFHSVNDTDEYIVATHNSCGRLQLIACGLFVEELSAIGCATRLSIFATLPKPD